MDEYKLWMPLLARVCSDGTEVVASLLLGALTDTWPLFMKGKPEPRRIAVIDTLFSQLNPGHTLNLKRLARSIVAHLDACST